MRKPRPRIEMKPTRPVAVKSKRRAKRLECLGDFVHRIRNEKRLSLSDVSKQSALFGPPISGSYINRIERDSKVRVTPDRLKALAHGLGIPVQELFTHAVREMSREEADELALVTRFRELSSQGKSYVCAMIKVLHSGDSSDNAAS